MAGRIIPELRIAIDSWNLRNKAHIQYYFLTHMHSDHYNGLKDTWQNTIYCSEVTKELLILKFKFNRSQIKELQLQHPICLELSDKSNVMITAYDANHCPGAIMLLIESDNNCILYTGDFRYDKSIEKQYGWTNLYLKNIDILYIDDTLIKQKYLPTRAEIVQQIIDWIKKHSEYRIIFGLYAIGKEYLLNSVYSLFREKIFVEPKRFEMMKIIEKAQRKCIDMDEKDINIINMNIFSHIEKDSRFLVIDQTKINKMFLDSENQKCRTICIMPTSRSLFRKFNNLPSTHVFPLTDHSCFDEMHMFAKKVRPKVVFPITKNNNNISVFNDCLRNTDSIIHDLTTAPLCRAQNNLKTLNKESSSTVNCLINKKVLRNRFISVNNDVIIDKTDQKKQKKINSSSSFENISLISLEKQSLKRKDQLIDRTIRNKIFKKNDLLLENEQKCNKSSTVSSASTKFTMTLTDTLLSNDSNCELEAQSFRRNSTNQLRNIIMPESNIKGKINTKANLFIQNVFDQNKPMAVKRFRKTLSNDEYSRNTLKNVVDTKRFHLMYDNNFIQTRELRNKINNIRSSKELCSCSSDIGLNNYFELRSSNTVRLYKYPHLELYKSKSESYENTMNATSNELLRQKTYNHGPSFISLDKLIKSGSRQLKKTETQCFKYIKKQNDLVMDPILQKWIKDNRNFVGPSIGGNSTYDFEDSKSIRQINHLNPYVELKTLSEDKFYIGSISESLDLFKNKVILKPLISSTPSNIENINCTNNCVELTQLYGDKVNDQNIYGSVDSLENKANIKLPNLTIPSKDKNECCNNNVIKITKILHANENNEYIFNSTKNRSFDSNMNLKPSYSDITSIHENICIENDIVDQYAKSTFNKIKNLNPLIRDQNPFSKSKPIFKNFSFFGNKPKDISYEDNELEKLKLKTLDSEEIRESNVSEKLSLNLSNENIINNFNSLDVSSSNKINIDISQHFNDNEFKLYNSEISAIKFILDFIYDDNGDDDNYDVNNKINSQEKSDNLLINIQHNLLENALAPFNSTLQNIENGSSKNTIDINEHEDVNENLLRSQSISTSKCSESNKIDCSKTLINDLVNCKVKSFSDNIFEKFLIQEGNCNSTYENLQQKCKFDSNNIFNLLFKNINTENFFENYYDVQEYITLFNNKFVKNVEPHQIEENVISLDSIKTKTKPNHKLNKFSQNYNKIVDQLLCSEDISNFVIQWHKENDVDGKRYFEDI